MACAKQLFDLLLEYLETAPLSSKILATLGRAYLLDHQPEKAVTYLKQSLEVKQGTSTAKSTGSIYQVDDFNDDDMSYVEAEASISIEKEFELDVDESTSPAEVHKQQEAPSRRPILHIVRSKLKGSQPGKKKDTKIKYRSKQKPLINSYSMPPFLTPPSPPNTVQEPTQSINTNPSEEITGTENNQPPKLTSLIALQTKPPGFTPVEKSGRQPSIDLHDDLLNRDELDVIYDEQAFPDELLEDEVSDGVGDIDDESFIHSPPLLNDDVDEFEWDNLDDLDEFDESAHREIKEDIQNDGEISREVRARQIAAEVLDKAGWELKHLSLLQQIFLENGWSATRIAIEREMEKGLQPEELAVSRKIRLFWSQNEQYWITFHKINTNMPSNQADAAYKHMSWPESLRIIRCYPSLPVIEEIYMFIDETFDHWYNSNRLRRSFKAFFKFLKYRLGSMHRTLPGDYIFSFHCSMDADTGVDSDRLNNPNTPESQELMELGLQLNQWPHPPENKMKIIKVAT